MATEARSSGIPPRQALIVGGISLICGLLLLVLWKGLVAMIAGRLPHAVYEVCGFVAKAGIFLAMAKGGLGLAPTYNRIRIWTFVIALVAILVNMLDHPSAGNIVLRSAQLFMTLWFLLVYRPPHEPFSRCPWKWLWGTKAMVAAVFIGWGGTVLVPGAWFRTNGWWIAISIAGGIVMYVAVLVQVSGLAKSDSVTFLSLYGAGNAIMVLSYFGQYNSAGMFINLALSVLLLGKLLLKLVRWYRQRRRGRGEAKAGPPVAAMLTAQPAEA